MDWRGGFDMWQFWRQTDAMAAAQAPKVDRAALRSELRRSRPDLDALVAAIDRDGLIVLPDYWSAEKSAAARAEIDRLIALHPESVNAFSGGADKRIFGVEAASSLLAEFHDDPFLIGFGELLHGLKLQNFVTLGARIDATPSNNGSGDGWHRDAHGFQFKSILYLSDTDERNGPFEYLPGSHRRWRAALDAAIANLPAAPITRYNDEYIARLRRFNPAPRVYPGAAGTLVLAYTCGIHRGRPLEHGSRYALTNYFYYPFQIGETRIAQFTPLIPGAAERIRSMPGFGQAF